MATHEPSSENAPLKSPGGRKAFVPTPFIRGVVTRAAAQGITQEETARLLDISETTLKKYFSDELKTGIEDYDGAVVKNLRRHALGTGPGAITAMIYWTKVRLGWSERVRLEVSFGPVMERMVSGFLDLLHRAIPDFCPGCRTALNLKPEIARLLIAESQKLSGAAAAAAASEVAPQTTETGT